MGRCVGNSLSSCCRKTEGGADRLLLRSSTKQTIPTATRLEPVQLLERDLYRIVCSNPDDDHHRSETLFHPTISQEGRAVFVGQYTVPLSYNPGRRSGLGTTSFDVRPARSTTAQCGGCCGTSLRP